MIKEEERVYLTYIPPNFNVGANLFGISSDVPRLLQGVALAVIPYLIILPSSFLRRVDGSTKFGVATVIAIGLFLLGVVGINGDPFFTWVRKVLLFSSKKRMAYYNPRIKIEKTEEKLKPKEENNLLPRDKIAILYNQFVDGQNKKDQVLAKEAYDSFEKEIDFEFEDDPETEEERKDFNLWEKIKAKMQKLLENKVPNNKSL